MGQVRDFLRFLAVVAVIVGSRFLGMETYQSLLAATALTMVLSLCTGHGLKETVLGVVLGLKRQAMLLLILVCIAALVGVWMVNGTLGMMMLFSLQICRAKYLLPMTFLFCFIMSWGTGSAYSTIISIGLVMVQTAESQSIPAAVAAGAVISGAFLGNKISPVSDMVNFASSTLELDASEHIKRLLPRTLLTAGLTLVFYLLVNLRSAAGGTGHMEAAAGAVGVIRQAFGNSPLPLLCFVLLISLALFRVPTLQSLLVTLAVSVLLALVSGSADGRMLLSAAVYGAAQDTSPVRELLFGGGILQMIDTLRIIICAALLSGALQVSRIPEKAVSWVLRYVKQPVWVMLTVLLTDLLLCIAAASQLLGLTILGVVLKPVFENLGLTKYDLAGIFADTEVVFCPIPPWGGIAVLTQTMLAGGYAPYAVFCWLSPLIAIARLLFLSRKRTDKI